MGFRVRGSSSVRGIPPSRDGRASRLDSRWFVTVRRRQVLSERCCTRIAALVGRPRVDVARDVLGVAAPASVGRKRLGLAQPVHVSPQSLRTFRIKEVVSERGIETRHQFREGLLQIVRKLVRVERVDAEASSPFAEPALSFRRPQHCRPILAEVPDSGSSIPSSLSMTA